MMFDIYIEYDDFDVEKIDKKMIIHNRNILGLLLCFNK